MLAAPSWKFRVVIVILLLFVLQVVSLRLQTKSGFTTTRFSSHSLAFVMWRECGLVYWILTIWLCYFLDFDLFRIFGCWTWKQISGSSLIWKGAPVHVQDIEWYIQVHEKWYTHSFTSKGVRLLNLLSNRFSVCLFLKMHAILFNLNILLSGLHCKCENRITTYNIACLQFC